MAQDCQRVPDCEPRLFERPLTRLERIAKELEAKPSELRWFLQELIQQRLRERGDAWAQLDSTLEARARR